MCNENVQVGLVAATEHRERQEKYERKVRWRKLSLEVVELKNIKKKQSALLQKQAKELNKLRGKTQNQK